MKLDEITANVRLRTPWEAMDLGFALVRQSFQLIYLPWFIFLGLFAALCFAIFPDDYVQYAPLAVWFFKPLYDRFLLHILSQRLFNEQLSAADALRALPLLLKSTGLAGGLTLRRASFSRGFNLPIWQLEQLRGKARLERQRVLLSSAHSHAIALTLAMIFIELTIYFSVYALIVLFVPESFQGSLVSLFFAQDLIDSEIGFWLHVLDFVIYSLAVFLIEPFYVAASFALYLNRRTQLEAWDIELVFRQLARRLQQQAGKLPAIALLPFLLFSLFGAVTQPAYANKDEQAQEFLAGQRLPASQSGEVIADVIKRPELSNEKVTREWIKTSKEKKKQEKDRWWDLSGFFKPIIRFFSIVFESSLWLALAALLLMAFLSRKKWLRLLHGNHQAGAAYQAPEVLFGMDIRQQSLPQNIPAAARELWRQHQHRESLSLLYRGALAQLVNVDKLPLKSSQTEGDILKLTKKLLQPARHSYLQALTRQWKTVAYAHRIPAEVDMQYLFDCWRHDFTTPQQQESDDEN